MEATRRQRVLRAVVIMGLGVGGAALASLHPIQALRSPAFLLLCGAMGLWTVLENIALRQDEPASYRGKLQTRLMQAAVMLGVYVGAAEFFLASGLLPRTWLVHTLGLGLIAAGAALRIAAIRTLARHFSYELRVEDGHRIVDSGPYRILRHPSYLGIWLICVGAPLALASLWGALVGALAMGALVVWRVHTEEAMLRGAFGSSYDEYSKRTWRVVPFVY